MKVTIGIPFYNSEKFLFYAIASVLKQTFVDFELILSNDGSTDKSLEIASSFADSRIKIVNDDHKRGLVYRLNEQLNMANGEYFARMDSDDIMSPNRIEEQIKYMDNNHKVDVIGSSLIIIDNENKILGLRDYIVPNNNFKVFLSVPLAHPSVMGRTNWFKKYYYDEKREGFEDADLWIRSYKESNFASIREPLIFYRDPIDIDVSKVLNRYKKAREAYCEYDSKLISRYHKIIVIALSYIKSIIYWVASKFGVAMFIINKRNNSISKKKRSFFKKELEVIISN